MSNSTEIQKTQLVQISEKLYGVRENLTVWVGQRTRLSNGEIDEGQAIFERTAAPNQHGYQRKHEVVINLPELQQIAAICGYQQPKQIEWSNMFEPVVKDQNPAYKEFKIRDCGMKFNLTVYENTRLDLEYKYYKGDKYAFLSLEIGDVLAVLELIKLEEPPFILEKKTITVGEHQVRVRRQDMPGSDKPLQLFIQTEIAGVTVASTSSYPEGFIVNRDSDYANFDEERAQKFVASHQRFLAQFEKDPSAQPDEPFALMAEDDDEIDASLYAGPDHTGEECPVCGHPLTESGWCTGNGCDADLGS